MKPTLSDDGICILIKNFIVDAYAGVPLEPTCQ